MVTYFKDHNIHLEAVFDEGGGIFAQAFSPVISHPVAVIGLSEKGYLDLELSTDGKGGHSGTPLAQTTIGIISKAITKLEEAPFTPKFEGLQREFFDNLGRHMRYSDRVLMANNWLFKPWIMKQLTRSPDSNAFIRTTSAATVFNSGIQSNVIPAEAKATVNFRIIPGETVDEVLKKATKIIDDPRITIKTLKAVNPSPQSSSNTKSFDFLKAAIQSLYPTEQPIIIPYVTPGVTESHHFSEVSDNQYRFLPVMVTNAEMDGFHGTNEQLSIENL